MSASLKLAEKECWTYRDCLQCPDDYRAEIIDGEVYEMQAPTTKHQAIVMNLSAIIWTFLRDKPEKGKVYPAPFGVRLWPKTDYSDAVYFEPDIVVMCDRAKLGEKGCEGAPDMVVEILSPSSASKDMVLKFRKYAQAGVREYWIIDPDRSTIQVCLLENGGYKVAAYEETDTVPVTILPGLEIKMPEVFSEE
ncbi:hypothetical protein FACS189494_11450 [Spirochaetia bacterium]|nr:hypothetical protein FACS189494_11450 [Spirochaetia bacterium]